MMTLDAKLEAILFFRGEAVSFKELASSCEVSEGDVQEALEILTQKLESRGLNVILHNNTAQLVTAGEASDLIEALRKEELAKDLGRAGSEVLAILLYKGPSTRADIDYIRGVNSTGTLRHLLIRGLVEKSTNPTDGRSYLYKPTSDLLAFLGVTSVEQLNDFGKIKETLYTILKEHDGDE